MMRKLALTAALATTALATPALARDNAWYVGVEGGAMIVEDIDFKLSDTETQINSTDSDYGWDVGGIVGYDFGGFRLEAEVSYREANVESHTTSVPLGGIPVGTYEDAAFGDASALSFMVNALLDFGPDDGLQGFVGGGAGVARVKYNEYGILPVTLVDDSDTVFAWQAIAGVRAPLSDNVDVTFKYRFFNADDVKTVAFNGAELESRFRSHSVLGGLTFNFGAPPPPPPPAPEPAPMLPPAPAPAPAPEPVVCTPGPYIVFFEWDRSDITPEAGGILDNAVSAYQSCGNAQVMLAGHADRSGAASYNVGLSQRRADAVRSYLGSRGIPDGVMTTEAFGESRPRVDTADGVRELQNRRVEITYGPGSGM